MKKVTMFVIMVLIFGTTQVTMGQIAITEFMNDPLGADTDMGGEYIELYNYGETDVDIQNWTLKDEDHDVLGGGDYFTITDASFIIPPGGYVVLASNKDTLAAHWFGGVADARVIEYGGPNNNTMALSNSGDELILLDAAGDTVWNFAWMNDDAYDGSKDDGYSTYLDYATDFSTTVTSWGNKASPGIVRNGNDNVAGSPLGYEMGAFTADASAWVSVAGNSGSPLTGTYQEKSTVRSEYKIAITEFINDPLGADTDMGSEYIELYNYGETDIDIQNWTLKDEDHDELGGADYFTITEASFIIPAGGYAVLAANKDTLAAHWFGGVADARVIEYGGPNNTTMQLSNSGDELILLDAAGDTVWNFAWMNDDEYDPATGADDGYSTYLDYATDFSTTVTSWGNKAAPGIVRNGNDNVAGSPLGYEGGAFTADASAWVSVAGNSGSPLTGTYQEEITARSEYKIAITEFINDPLGADTDMGSEYIELYNYGETEIDIQNWTLKDEDHDELGGPDYFTITETSFIIPAGGYAVLAASKDTLAAHWFSGVADARVIEYGGPNNTTMQLSNSGDELILLDAAGDTVWNFAWSNDDEYDPGTSSDDGYSTYLDYATDFSTTVTSWGNKAAPGIVRNGNDNVAGSPLGYEGGAFTADVSAWVSVAGNSGSPLAGSYQEKLTARSEYKIAITEFINDPLGPDTDMGSEYIELYNYGETDIDIQNWTLKDEDHDELGGPDYFTITETSFIIPAGGYAVLAANKDTLAAHWFGGVADVRVLEYGGPNNTTMQLSNSGDELILLDAVGDTVWNFAWSNDDEYDPGTSADDGYSTYLDYATDFSTTVTGWGNKANPGIVRNGNDNVAGSPLGYEGGAFTADVSSWVSVAGNSGSPLTGNYQEKLTARSEYKIAITEFINDPLGPDTDMGSEYIELYNYGETDIDIQNWTLKDEDHDELGGADYFTITEASFIIPAGGYAVLTANKDTLAAHWFGGVADARVIEYGGPNNTTMQLSNSGDELILLDAVGDTVWNFAWSNDDEYDPGTSADDGYSTYLDYATDFSTTVTGWGNKANPGIVRNGNDNVAGSPLGYEGGAFTADVSAWVSVAGNSGSPLTGNYQEKLAVRSEFKIAITEFMNDPLGPDTDMGSEYIELFNYGTTDVDIIDWTLKDEDHDSLGGADYFIITEASFIIPPGGYAVLAANKDTLAAHWLGGESDARVLEYGGPNNTTMQLSNSGDELILLDAAGDTVWNFAWTNDDEYDPGTSADDGYSTYLDYATDFSTTVTGWGNKANPGIVRNGNDNVAGSPLGYEGGAFTADVSAWVSVAGNSGSPLAGNYIAPTGRSTEKVAITEFMNDPLGNDTDMGSEYIELFNYGTTEVEIKDWTLKDEDHDELGGADYFIITEASFIIPPGGYAVLATNKDTLATHWFGGVADARVIEYGGPNTSTMQLSNSGDELILLDAAGDTVWNFAWTNDDAYDGTTDDGYSTYLDYATDFSTTVISWGNKAAPGIVRNGNDNVFGSPLGYEGGAFTADVAGWISVAGNSGSPLTGNYVPLPTEVDNSTDGILLPSGYVLKQNYPNPFNPTTNIHYQLPERAHISLIVYDLLGKKVATLVNEQQNAGLYNIQWDIMNDTRTAVSTGVYLCSINAKGLTRTYNKVIKMLYVK